MLKTVQLFFLLLLGSSLFATHNLAGDITYTHLGGLTYEFTVTIFADRASPAISRRDIEIDYGDNTGIDTLSETSRTELTINGIQILKRTWVGTHTFSGSDFTFTITVEDPNRNANVVNIDNSVNTPFTIRSRLTISSFPGEINNSVTLQNDPLDNACIGATYVYNAGAVDPDNDSLAYRIARSLGSGGAVAPMYTFPSASESITVDPITGDLIWRNPDLTGIFNVGIEILEYRNGRNIGSVLRDIQIVVVPGCTNNPPQILADQLVCIEAGETLLTNIVGTDIDNDAVELSATGELFEQPIASRTVFNSGVTGNPTNASFIWNTLCEDVRIQPYRLSIRAIDDAINRGEPTNLVNFQTINIRVIAPPPINFNASPMGRNIVLSWDNSNCNNGVGYYIYRRLDSTNFVPDSCTPGVPEELGFERIATINSINTLSYIDDDDLVPGQTYCYRITSFFEDGDESYSSLETCAEIEKVIPVITNVSIDSTDLNDGIVDLEWSPPTVFDATSFPPPYRYLIYESNSGDDINNFILIDSTNSLVDTSISIVDRNTEENAFAYRVDLYSLGNGRTLAGQSVSAESIYLSITPTDQVLQLNWNVNTPWNDTSFTIFRRLPSSNVFDSLTTVTSTSFNDSNLVNGLEYCYYIQATGFYNLSSVKSPLINLSQIACSSPIDNVSPCQVNFTVSGNCDLGDLTINWELPDSTCPMDVAQYRVYKSSRVNDELVLIDSILDPTQNSYSQRNDTIAGCYSISAVDSAGNESILGERQCIDYCPFYELPNVFTPNGDGINDFFVPIPLNNVTDFRHIDSIRLLVFNRWGNEVFTTNDPAINWSGERKGEKITQDAFETIQQSANPIADGVFYYVCTIYERRLDPNLPPRILNGTITILDTRSESED